MQQASRFRFGTVLLSVGVSFILLACSSDSEEPILESGLMAHYALSGNALDGAGTNHGEMHGALTPVPDRKGRANSALYFGKDNYITIPNLGLKGDISVFGWVKIDSTGNHPIMAILSQGANPGLRWHIESQPGYLVYYDNRAGDNSPYLIPAETKYGQWIFYGVVSSSENPDREKVKVFLNGQNVGVISSRPVEEIDSIPLNIGRYFHGEWAYCYGAIDEVWIFNRALSDSEVFTLYQTN